MKSKTIRPWLYVCAAFLLLLTAWSSLIFIAIKHSPERIQVQTSNFKSQISSPKEDAGTRTLD